MLSARKNGEVIVLHPKLIERWAVRYIKIYKEEGAVFAKRWATTFLPENARAVMSSRVKEILGKQKAPK